MSQSYSADFVIIGSGTIGTAIAYYLSKNHPGKIVLIDKNSVGSGSTSWAASMINRVRAKQILIPIVKETYQAIEELEQGLGKSLGAREVGSIHIASTEKSIHLIEQLSELSTTYSIRGEKLIPAEVKHFLPWINQREIKSAFLMPDDLYIDGYLLASAYSKMAKNLGITIKQNSEVLKLIVNDGRINGVKMADGSVISSPNVIHAGGAWSNLLLSGLEFSLPMAPVRSIYWITEAIPGKFPSCMPMAFFPDFYDTPISHSISGLSTYTPDGNPIIGESPILEGYFAASGCNGAGVALSAGYGRLVKEIILKEETYLPQTAFAIERFGNVNAFSRDFEKKCSLARSGKRNGG